MRVHLLQRVKNGERHCYRAQLANNCWSFTVGYYLERRSRKWCIYRYVIERREFEYFSSQRHSFASLVIAKNVNAIFPYESLSPLFFFFLFDFPSFFFLLLSRRVKSTIPNWCSFNTLYALYFAFFCPAAEWTCKTPPFTFAYKSSLRRVVSGNRIKNLSNEIFHKNNSHLNIMAPLGMAHATHLLKI